MAYNKPTSLRVPLLSVMEWSGKRIFTDIIKDDARFETKKLGSTNDVAINIYFAWKPDSLQLDEVVEEEEQDTSAKRAKKGKKDAKTSRPALGSPERRKRAVGIRTRSQAQLEEADSGGKLVVKREPGENDEVVVKEEESANNDESNFPNILNIINGRS